MAGIFTGIGKLAGGLFGASRAPKQPTFNFFPNITTPAFNLRTSPGGDVTLSRLADTQRFPNILSNLADLRGEVRPGFGRFTEAAVESIRRAKFDALGNVRQQLQRRRVQGSSFANAQLAGIEAEFGRQEAVFRGQALLEEIETTFRLIDAEAEVKTRNFQFELAELGVATGAAESLLQVISNQTTIDKIVASKAAEGVGEFGASVGELIGKGFGSIFGFEDKDTSGSSITGNKFGDLAVQAALKFAL